MELKLRDILSVLMNLDCAKCPTYNESIKETRINEAMRHIENSLIRQVLPPIKNHKFKNDVKCEVVAHVGGWNSLRATTIRRIRKFCASPDEKKYNPSKDLILID